MGLFRIGMVLLVLVTPGSTTAAEPVAADLREVMEEAVERQELCAAAAQRSVPPPYCAESSWAELCGELRRAQRWLTAQSRPLAVLQAHFDNAELLLTQFAGAVAVDLLCPHDGDASPPDPIESLWDHRDALAGAVGAYDSGLKLAVAELRIAMGELNYMVKLFRGFKSQVERAEVEREDDRVPSIRFGATKSADPDDYMRLYCDDLAERSRLAIDAVAAFSSDFESRVLARFHVEHARTVVRNSLSLAAWGREEMLDCDVAVEVPAWLTGDRTLPAGELVEVPALPEAAHVNVTRLPFDRRFVTETIEALDVLLACAATAEGDEGHAGCEESRDGQCTALDKAATQMREEVLEPIVGLIEAGRADGFRFSRAEQARIELLGPLARANTALEEHCERDRNADRWRRAFLDSTVGLVGDLDPGLGATLGQLLRSHGEFHAVSGVHAGVNPAIPRSDYSDRLLNQEITP